MKDAKSRFKFAKVQFNYSNLGVSFFADRAAGLSWEDRLHCFAAKKLQIERMLANYQLQVSARVRADIKS